MDLVLEIYRESPDWVKALWVLSIPAFIAAITGMVLWYRVETQRIASMRAVAPSVTELLVENTV